MLKWAAAVVSDKLFSYWWKKIPEINCSKCLLFYTSNVQNKQWYLQIKCINLIPTFTKETFKNSFGEIEIRPGQMGWLELEILAYESVLKLIFKSCNSMFTLR